MELHLVFSVVGFLPASLFIVFLWLKLSQSFKTQKRSPPEPSGAWPLLGHLRLLAGSKPAHLTLAKLADKYGPIFSLRLGIRRVIVVSSWEIAKECFTTNDRIFATRPKLLSMEILGFNYAFFGVSQYGPYWRHVRKLVIVEFLSSHGLEKIKHIRESEIQASISQVYESWVNNGKAIVEMKRWFGDLTLNAILRMVVGKRIQDAIADEGADEESEQLRLALRRFFELTGEFVISDALPFLRLFDLGGKKRAMENTAKVLDNFVSKCLTEHRERRKSGGPKAENDVMDVLISVLEGKKETFDYDHDADTIIKATSLALILASTDTTTVTLTWALALLLNNPEVLKKAQQEIDNQVGKERELTEVDLDKLPYLHAIHKETLRLHPAGPLSVPHESMEDCSLVGYDIPSGTRLLVNLTKIHRDPSVWKDPNKFQPERFLTTHKEVDVRGQNFELLPFGSGRRKCPGISYAMQIMQLSLGSLLHKFDVETPFGKKVDMVGTSGLTDFKESPFEVIFTPRLPPHMYA